MDLNVLIVVAAVAFGIVYFTSTWLHPFRPCGSCNGTGVHKGGMFKKAHRNCASCGGKGRFRRPGAPSAGKAFGESRKR